MPSARGGGRNGRKACGMAASAAKQPKKRGGLLAGALILLLLALALWQLTVIRGRLADARAEQSALEESVARQEQENRSLEAALERAEDPEYLQQLARDQLGMVTPGQKDFYDVSN